MTLRERIVGTLVQNMSWAGGFLLGGVLLVNVIVPFMQERGMVPEKPVTFVNQPVEDR